MTAQELASKMIGLWKLENPLSDVERFQGCIEWLDRHSTVDSYEQKQAYNLFSAYLGSLPISIED